MPGRLVVSFDGKELFSRDVQRVECEHTASGKLTLNADYPSIEGHWRATTFEDKLL